EREAEADETDRLLPATVEGMRDAARHRHLAQVLEQSILRAPHMQQHRKIVRPRDLELGSVEALLSRRIEVRDEEVEPDLADRDELRILATCRELGVQPGERLFLAGIDAQGVDAERVVDAGMAAGEGAHRTEVAGIDG